MARIFGAFCIEDILECNWGCFPVDIIGNYDEEGVVIEKVVTSEGDNIINNLSYEYLMDLVWDHIASADYHYTDHGD